MLRDVLNISNAFTRIGFESLICNCIRNTNISRNNLTNRDFLDSSVVNTSQTDISLSKGSCNQRVRAVALPMTHLIAILAQLVGRWSFGIAGPSVALRKSNRITLVEPNLHRILPLKRMIPHIRSRCMVLGFR